MKLEELKQVKKDLDNGIIISKATWARVLETAIALSTADSFSGLISQMNNMEWKKLGFSEVKNASDDH